MTSWAIASEYATLFGRKIWSEATPVLIDPSYPYIGLPEGIFVEFLRDIEEAEHDHPIFCHTHVDWCYFEQPCEKIVSKMPDFKITFNGSLLQNGKNTQLVTYNVPASSYLFEQESKAQCHVGLINQKESTD